MVGIFWVILSDGNEFVGVVFRVDVVFVWFGEFGVVDEEIVVDVVSEVEGVVGLNGIVDGGEG